MARLESNKKRFWEEETWYILHEGEPVGPLSARELALRPEVSQRTLACARTAWLHGSKRRDEKDWVPLGDLPVWKKIQYYRRDRQRPKWFGGGRKRESDPQGSSPRWTPGHEMCMQEPAIPAPLLRGPPLLGLILFLVALVLFEFVRVKYL